MTDLQRSKSGGVVDSCVVAVVGVEGSRGVEWLSGGVPAAHDTPASLQPVLCSGLVYHSQT